ncbi:uncharacterized protein LOC141630147 [Silene latifolia]|uniref:uncharacterized protein LOC141630147 n=1 Tax=Silene latifolia TaxID=37657 RepID=UPI003D782CDF
MESILEEESEDWVDVSRSSKNGDSNSESLSRVSSLQLTNSDVDDELKYWSSAVYCYVLGANPPWKVIDGFVKRIWGYTDYEKLSFHSNGIFVVRFKTEEMKLRVLQAGPIIFDNKPVVVKEWTPTTKLVKEAVNKVPIRIRIYGLPLKFWGNSLKKIAGLVGVPVRCDSNTQLKTFLGYARVMVEVKVGDVLPDVVEFDDEMDIHHRQIVHYEWKPVICTECKIMGHIARDCRRKERNEAPKAKKVWVPKKTGGGTQAAPPKAPDPVLPVTIPRVSTVTMGLGNGLITPLPFSFHPSFSPTRIITQMTRQGGFGTGIGRGTYLEMLEHSIQIRKVGVFGLLETRVRLASIKKVHQGIGAHWSLVTNIASHEGGRIWIIWDDINYKVEVHSTEAQVINTNVTYLPTNESWWMSMVYGFNRIGEREVLWESLCTMSRLIDGPWVVLGDFNNGAFFTWTNKHEVGAMVLSRIDRALITDDWLDRYPDTLTTFHPEGIFDHCPCTMVLRPELNSDRLSNIETSAEVAKMHMFEVQKKLQGNPINLQLQAQAKAVADAYKELDEARRKFLVQKAKAQWMKCGDENTQYFHSVIKAIRLQNKVLSIQDMRGVTHTDPDVIEPAFVEYYIQLLGTSKKVNTIHVPVVKMGRTLTGEHVTGLLRPVSESEVKEALFSIPANKAPGPDGFSSQFFRNAYPVVGQDVVQAVLEFFTNGKLLRHVNATTLTLIPKKARPTSIADFRPLACCNVIYKTISKVLCNRVATVLPHIISENQSAFIKGREIVDNILICQDLEFIEQMLGALGFPEKIINLIMADDLLMFCRGDRHSLIVILRAFATFSGSSGLAMNQEKSEIYFNGMDAGEVAYILQLSGFKVGQFSFRYLGIPISYKRIAVGDCSRLVENIVERIRGWGARKLSYAGRLVLIKAVLTQLHVFWDRIFIIPVTVIDKITSICRNYLWAGSDQYGRAPAVAWEKICLGKKYGGLGIVDYRLWNTAEIAKYTAWTICKVKDRVKAGFVNDVWCANQGQYTVGKLYTKDRMMRFGVISDGLCELCRTHMEDHQHLFYLCDFSVRCWTLLRDWLGVPLPATGILPWEENRVPAPWYIVNEIMRDTQNLYRSREESSRFKLSIMLVRPNVFLQLNFTALLGLFRKLLKHALELLSTQSISPS